MWLRFTSFTFPPFERAARCVGCCYRRLPSDRACLAIHVCVCCVTEKRIERYLCVASKSGPECLTLATWSCLVHKGLRHAVDFRWINTVHTSVDTSGDERSAFLFGEKKTDLPSASSAAEDCRKSGANISNLLTLPLLRKTHPFLRLDCGYIWSIQAVPHTPLTKTYILNIGFIPPPHPSAPLLPFGSFFFFDAVMPLSSRVKLLLPRCASSPRCLLFVLTPAVYWPLF